MNWITWVLIFVLGIAGGLLPNLFGLFSPAAGG
jgi:hypothetical protein